MTALSPNEPGVTAPSGGLRAGLVSAGPLAAAGLIGNGMNVVVTVIMARLLDTRGYGSLAQLTGLFLILSMPGSAVVVGVVRRVVSWHGEGVADLVHRWAAHRHRQLSAAVVVFALIVVILGPVLARALAIRSGAGAVFILIAGAVWLLLSIDRGLLQAHRNYNGLAINLLVEAGVRTAAMLALVGAGLGVSGAALGVLVAEITATTHARVLATRAWNDGSGREPLPGFRESLRALIHRDTTLVSAQGAGKELSVDFVTAFAALGLLALLQNIDVIVLGRLNPHGSGSYAAISVASKAIVFGAVALGAYLVPEAAIRWRAGGHALRPLAVTVLLLAVPGAALLAIALGDPKGLLRLVFGARYQGAAAAFAVLVLAMMALALTVVLTLYLLAVGWRFVVALLAVAGAAATILVVAAHGRPLSTAQAELGVQGVLALVTLTIFVWLHRHRTARGVRRNS